ncbi:O-antigen ligase [Thiohalospira halophila DSM 15071]|uniref:O-antigen ligase n=1 Tax=Thiohalospira halophila DSM 15071 TaxID=1123397 RepID=A0A1I1RRW6_9GAMM|nr:O-antigen ligase family protein [Thiohalospira halophila]SFD37074.1 O-antigen ligase [Thiohalospira halophila DSM 15071]
MSSLIQSGKRACFLPLKAGGIFEEWFSRYLWASFSVFVVSVFFYSGDIRIHRSLYYILVFAPFLIVYGLRWQNVRLMLSSRLFSLVVILSLFAIASSFVRLLSTGDITNLFDSIRYGVLLLGTISITVFVASRGNQYLDYLCRAFALGAAISALIAVTNYFNEEGALTVGGRMDGVLAYAGHPIKMAELYAVAAISALALSLHSAYSRRREIFWSAVYSLCAIPIFLSQSRGPILALFVTTIVLLVAFKRWRLASGLIVLVGVGFLSIVNSLIEYRDPLYADTVWVRIAIWEAALGDWWKNPIFGTGWVGPQSVSELVRGRYHQPHNVYLAVLLQGGLLGFLLFVALLLRALYVGLGAVKNSVAIAAGFGVILFFAVNGFSISRWIYDNPDLVWLEFWVPLAFIVAREVLPCQRCN